MRISKIWLLALFLGLSGPVRGEPLIVIDVDDCRHIVAHRPAPDVAYQPGQDARGRAVAPADLPSSGSIRTPEKVGIDLIIPLSTFLGDDTPPFTEDAEVNAGRVVVDTVTGEISYNGQSLGDPAANAIAAECARQLKARK